jgi:hypothetical protein
MGTLEVSGPPKNTLEKHEKILAQIYVAFGQGTGEIRVAREACQALHAHALPHLAAMAVNWDTDAVQVLERVRAIGRASRQQAVGRFDTAVHAQDIELVVPLVKTVSATPMCVKEGTLTPGAVRTVIHQQTIDIGKHTLSLPISYEQLAATLGSPTRTVNKTGAPNQLLIWDMLGLVGYQSNVTNKIVALSFYLKLFQERLATPVVLAGPLSIADTAISPRSTSDSVGHDLQGKGGKHVSRLALGFWTLNYGRFQITLEQTESPTIEAVVVGLPE